MFIQVHKSFGLKITNDEFILQVKIKINIKNFFKIINEI